MYLTMTILRQLHAFNVSNSAQRHRMRSYRTRSHRMRSRRIRRNLFCRGDFLRASRCRPLLIRRTGRSLRTPTMATGTRIIVLTHVANSRMDIRDARLIC